MTKPKATIKTEAGTEKMAQKTTPKPAWQKPHLQKLRISLDTASFPGSGGDGFGRSSIAL